MRSKNYAISPAKIGSQDGFRLPKAFSHDHPHLVAEKGYIEMVDKNTFLVHFDPDNDLDNDEDEDESLMLKLFLDTLMKFAIEKPDSLTPYTQQMADEMDELLAGVTVDEDG
jgi:antitoxin PrlF